MDPTHLMKLFWTSGQLVENDLSRIEQSLQVDLGRRLPKDAQADEIYYPQFEKAVREEAARMSEHYEVFYCLERTIRAFVSSLLAASYGATWWDTHVPPAVLTAVKDRIKKDTDAGVTLRSDAPLDFTTFGELGEIIRGNWDVFGSVFNSQAAVTKVLTMLNTLRGPIAHCAPLAEDEVVRLRLSVRDWFRLMDQP